MPWDNSQSFNKWKIDQVANKEWHHDTNLTYKLEIMLRFGWEIIIRTHKLLHGIDILFFNSVFVLDSDGPVWSNWSDFGPCSSNCKKTRQRFCTSSNKDIDCSGHFYGVESQEVVCPSQECKG